MDGWTNDFMLDEWMDGLMINGRMDGRTVTWMYGQSDRQMQIQMRQMDDNSMLNGWTDAFLKVFVCFFKYFLKLLFLVKI